MQGVDCTVQRVVAVSVVGERRRGEMKRQESGHTRLPCTTYPYAIQTLRCGGLQKSTLTDLASKLVYYVQRRRCRPSRISIS